MESIFVSRGGGGIFSDNVDIFIDKSFLSFVFNISQQSKVRSSYVLGKRKYTIFFNFFYLREATNRGNPDKRK